MHSFYSTYIIFARWELAIELNYEIDWAGFSPKFENFIKVQFD